MRHLPWWPALCVGDVHSVPREVSHYRHRAGDVLVRFLGEGSYAWLRPKRIVPWHAEGAEYRKRLSSVGTEHVTRFRIALMEAEDIEYAHYVRPVQRPDARSTQPRKSSLGEVWSGVPPTESSVRRSQYFFAVFSRSMAVARLRDGRGGTVRRDRNQLTKC